MKRVSGKKQISDVEALQSTFREYWKVLLGSALPECFDEKSEGIFPFSQKEAKLSKDQEKRWLDLLFKFLYDLLVPKDIIDDLIKDLYVEGYCPPFDLEKLETIVLEYNEVYNGVYKIGQRMTKYHNTPGYWDAEKKQWVVLPPEDTQYGQSHTSYNVFAHSFWTAAQILEWSEDVLVWVPIDRDVPKGHPKGLSQGYPEHSAKNPEGRPKNPQEQEKPEFQVMVEKNFPLIDYDIDIREAMVAAFLHDISKASKCGYTCLKNKCWFDVYSTLNYNGLEDRIHPVVSGDILMGKDSGLATDGKMTVEDSHVFWLQCPDPNADPSKGKDPEYLRKWKAEHKEFGWVLPDEFFDDLGVDRRLMALIAYMHWEIGTVNFKMGRGDPKAFSDYLDLFEKYCEITNLSPTIQNLKKCMLIAMADIRASAPPDLYISSVEGKQYSAKKEYIRRTVPILSGLVKQFGADTHNIESFYAPKNKVNGFDVNNWEYFEMDKNSDKIWYKILEQGEIRGYSHYNSKAQ